MKYNPRFLPFELKKFGSGQSGLDPDSTFVFIGSCITFSLIEFAKKKGNLLLAILYINLYHPH